jgi:hypothetical protein
MQMSRPEGAPPGRGRAARLLLPTATSAAHGLLVLMAGFATEGGTELFQFLERGSLAQGPVVYYTTLATTLLGFYLMFLGVREWRSFHPKSKPARLGSGSRPIPWFGLVLWSAGTAATAGLSMIVGLGGPGSAPYFVAWPVGGIVVLAFGDFFFGLRKLVDPYGSPPGRALGWTAFAWSIGVATIAGLVIGERVIVLVTELVTNWVALVASLGPFVIAMSPLALTYGLLLAAYWPALHGARTAPTRSPPATAHVPGSAAGTGP